MISLALQMKVLTQAKYPITFVIDSGTKLHRTYMYERAETGIGVSIWGRSVDVV